MKGHRPVNLNLFTIRLPITAVVSISHRISGVLLFLSLPALIWALEQSLASPDSFDQLMLVMKKPHIKMLIWVVGMALYYHALAGVRHLLMDVGLGENLETARLTAYVVLGLTTVVALMWACWLWVV